MGFFVPHGPHAARPDDPRIVHTARVIRESSLDLVDLHAYPGGELTMQQFAENFGITGEEQKPIVLGELGGIVAAYPTARDAAIGVVAWQVESCALGIDGWYQWRWEDSVTDVYGTLVEGGIINEAMAPLNRPDPCAYGDVVPRQLREPRRGDRLGGPTWRRGRSSPSTTATGARGRRDLRRSGSTSTSRPPPR